eukprot:PhM_4_TR17863/c0_g1_i1/m.59487
MFLRHPPYERLTTLCQQHNKNVRRIIKPTNSSTSSSSRTVSWYLPDTNTCQLCGTNDVQDWTNHSSGNTHAVMEYLYFTLDMTRPTRTSSLSHYELFANEMHLHSVRLLSMLENLHKNHNVFDSLGTFETCAHASYAYHRGHRILKHLSSRLAHSLLPPDAPNGVVSCFQQLCIDMVHCAWFYDNFNIQSLFCAPRLPVTTRVSPLNKRAMVKCMIGDLYKYTLHRRTIRNERNSSLVGAPCVPTLCQIALTSFVFALFSTRLSNLMQQVYATQRTVPFDRAPAKSPRMMTNSNVPNHWPPSLFCFGAEDMLTARHELHLDRFMSGI